MNASDVVCVLTVSGEFEAQQVKMFLEANGVPAELRGESLRITHALTLDGLGAVRIFVAIEDEERARDLLRQVDAGTLSVGESTGDDPAPGA